MSDRALKAFFATPVVMGIGLGLICIGAAVMIVALAALAICGVVALVDRLRGLGGARYSRTQQRHGRPSSAQGATPQPAPSRARLI